MQTSLIPTASAERAVPIHLVTEDTLTATIETLSTAARAWISAHRFATKSGRHLVVPSEHGTIEAVLFGLGRNSPETSPFLPGRLATLLPAGDYRFTGRLDRPELAALGWALSSYKFDRYRRSNAPRPRLAIPEGVDEDTLRRIVAGTGLARDLVNTPANDLGPAELAREAGDLAASYGADFAVIEGDRLEKEFPLIHAVGRASVRAPRLIDLTWGDRHTPRITIVGKGVCHDSGGLDIKTSSGMSLMKKDMGGAASALGLARMIMDADLPVRLRVLIPAVDNAISGSSFRTGDVIRSRAGLAVEIGNTDAEGRLILADALALAEEEEPDLLVDLATLTGAARVALGPDLPPFYTGDETLAADLARISVSAFDPLWRLPLWRAYDAMLDSKIADVSSTASMPMGGSVLAALFLNRFVDRARSWVHLDIYAWNPALRPGRPEGGEAQGIRALYALLEERYGR